MAGDYLPIRLDLDRDPSFAVIRARMGYDDNATMGAIVRVWCWFNQQTEHGSWAGGTPEMFDLMFGTPGLASAMQAARWLEVTDDGLSVPNWDNWNSAGAKRRLKDAMSKRVSRMEQGSRPTAPDKCPKTSDKSPASADLQDSTVQDNTVQSKPKAAPPPFPPEYEQAALAFVAYRKELKKPLTPSSIAKLTANRTPAQFRAAVDHTIQMGWQGLRDPEQTNSNGRAKPSAEAGKLQGDLSWLEAADRGETI